MWGSAFQESGYFHKLLECAILTGNFQAGRAPVRCLFAGFPLRLLFPDFLGHAMSIIDNRKAFHDYFIEEKFEAGMVLHGWEVKAIRAGRAHIKEAYVIIREGEIFVFGMHITPLATASTHVHPDPVRTRKLLLHAHQINKLIGKVERAGYALVSLDLHYAKGRIKLTVGLARGKKQYDKRESEKTRDWERQKARLMREKV
jgi:SsrA-binding protein